MNCCVQHHTTYHTTYFICYLSQDKFKNPKIIKIQQVHQKLSTKQVSIFGLYISICNSFEFKVTHEAPLI